MKEDIYNLRKLLNGFRKNTKNIKIIAQLKELLECESIANNYNNVKREKESKPKMEEEYLTLKELIKLEYPDLIEDLKIASIFL